MSNYYNLEGIKTEISRQIEQETARMEAWKKVTFPTKKDGKPFAILSKNIEGARLSPVSYATQPGENILSISTWSANNGCVHDEVKAYELVKYIKDEAMKAKTQNYQPKQTYLEQVYTYDLDDIKAAVAARIEHLEKRIASLEKQLERADEVYTTFKTAYAAAVKVLSDSAIKDDDKTLYYAVFDTIKNRFPYC